VACYGHVGEDVLPRCGWARRYARFVLLLCLLGLCLASCSPVQLITTHDYLLLHSDGPLPEVLADDDPLYAQFQDQVLSNSFLATLVSLFENTTTAYASANKPAPVPATVANHLLVVLDSPEAGTLYDLRAHYEKTEFSVELALGLGHRGQVDLAWARDHMAGAMGPLFLGLAGLPPVSGQADPHEMTAPDLALYQGLSAALEATYGQDPSVQARWRDGAQGSEGSPAQLDRVQLVLSNGYLFRYAGDQPTLQIRSREEAMRTPGVVATFFQRLFQRAGSYYPQRHLLWFFGYSSEQIPYAKVILALNSMAPAEPPSVQAFIDSYSDVFPSDREMVLALADEVFGPTTP